MNYTNLLKSIDKKEATIGLIGANGGFGYTFLNQLSHMREHIIPRVICDINAAKSLKLMKELGYEESLLVVCKSEVELTEVPKDKIIILEDANLMCLTDVEIVVEAAGLPELSSKYAEDALLHDKHVCMVSKEADCISGPYLYKLAKSRNLVYSIVIGDQPGNLINFLSWLETLGLEVICAGKSSEYDYVYDRKAGEITYKGESRKMPEFEDLWEYRSPETLAKRSKALSMYPQLSVGDYCEMNVISNATGFKPSCGRMHYPMCKPSELADIYIPKSEGGILERAKVLDVFNDLVRPDELSFAGGVYAIVKCDNDAVWDIIRGKGHIVRKDLKYACMYLPYHFMGVEAPMSIILTHYLNQSTYPDYKENSRMVCITAKDFKAGEMLVMKYERRHIADTEVELVSIDELSDDVVPYYMCAEKKFVRDVPKGTVVTEDMLDMSGSVLKRMRDSMRDE